MITVNSINPVPNYLELSPNGNKSSFKTCYYPKDKLLINQNNIDKIYQEKFGIMDINFLSRKNNNSEFESLSNKLKIILLNNKMFIQQAHDLNIFCTQLYE